MSDRVAARSQVYSVQFYVAIAMKMAAAVLKIQPFVNQTLMEFKNSVQKRAKVNSVPVRWYSDMKHLISRWLMRILL